jgi:DNA-binding MarR family transcriptional regulator
MIELRQSLLGVFTEPSTIKAAAEKLGVPPGRLYHHADRLEAEGLIQVVAERKRRAVTERTFQATDRRGAEAAAVRAAAEGLIGELAGGDLWISQPVLRLTPKGLSDLEQALEIFLKSFETPDGRETRLLWIASADA